MERLSRLYSKLTNLLSVLAPLVDLTLRAWLFVVFFWNSGLNKIQSWDSTLMLFENEYEVPLISADIAAYLGTMGELVLPLLLLIGLFSRFAAIGLFIVNLVALYSYPFLWTPQGSAGFHQHLYWGVMMMVLMAHGPGKISIDWLLNRKCKEYQY
ncbi:DoxX family protein [Candidatus Berkiella cookevillensis]|uniref:DoxX n=1 Tax=Candidatus Berkiella cookevillensis TaxID=437022 RepID=A0A0Q9YSV1_9GAMM|nr:DoxX family protein [Candidatus Berkiella cookevillensis]MCS5707630.1 DoxX family protein [Candidatus Berkiella cookevillensis]